MDPLVLSATRDLIVDLIDWDEVDFTVSGKQWVYHYLQLLERSLENQQ